MLDISVSATKRQPAKYLGAFIFGVKLTASLSFHDGVSALKCLVDDDGVGVVLELSAVIVGAAVALRDEGVLALVRVARLVRSHVVGHLPSVSVIKVTKGAMKRLQ